MSITFNQPLILLMHGLPGAGKSAFARQFAEAAGMAHVNSDRFRYELYDDASFTTSENNTVLRLCAYMTEELLKRGNCVIFDMHLPSQRLRDGLRSLATDNGAEFVLVRVQTDTDTAWWRASHRDRRRLDDKYAFNLSQAQYEELANRVNTNFRSSEKVIVISGKHLFKVQAATVLRRLQAFGLMPSAPNLHQRSGRIDYARRQPSRPTGL